MAACSPLRLSVVAPCQWWNARDSACTCSTSVCLLLVATWHTQQYFPTKPVMAPDAADLRNTASQLAAKGKGLLASDESIGTIGKRLEKAGIANTEVPECGRRQPFYV